MSNITLASSNQIHSLYAQTTKNVGDKPDIIKRVPEAGYSIQMPDDPLDGRLSTRNHQIKNYLLSSASRLCKSAWQNKFTLICPSAMILVLESLNNFLPITKDQAATFYMIAFYFGIAIGDLLDTDCNRVQKLLEKHKFAIICCPAILFMFVFAFLNVRGNLNTAQAKVQSIVVLVFGASIGHLLDADHKKKTHRTRKLINV